MTVCMIVPRSLRFGHQTPLNPDRQSIHSAALPRIVAFLCLIFLFLRGSEYWEHLHLLFSPYNPMPNLRWAKFLAAAVALATSMGRAHGSQTVDDCAPVWVLPRTSDSSSLLRSHQATEAAAPTARQPEQTAAQADNGTVCEAVLDGRRRRDQPATTLSNTWENSLTCGWVSGVSCTSIPRVCLWPPTCLPVLFTDHRHLTAYPWTCTDDWHCETNMHHAVGCVSGTFSPLYTECYDYTAWTNGLCNDTDSLTGCW